MLKQTLAVALAAITVAATVAPAEAHRRHRHGHHGGGVSFGFGFGGPVFVNRPYYGPRRYYSQPRYYYRRVPGPPQVQPAPWQTAPAAPYTQQPTYTPAPVIQSAPAPTYIPQQTYTPAPEIQAAPIQSYAPQQSQPVQTNTYAPSNPSYESIGAYENYSSQVQTAPTQVQAAPVQTYAAPTYQTDTLEVVPYDSLTNGSTYATSPQPVQTY